MCYQAIDLIKCPVSVYTEYRILGPAVGNTHFSNYLLFSTEEIISYTFGITLGRVNGQLPFKLYNELLKNMYC